MQGVRYPATRPTIRQVGIDANRGDPEGIDQGTDRWSSLTGLVAAGVAARAPAPTVVGIGGPVAVGKSTLAARLRRDLAPVTGAIEILGTDGFLLPNHELSARGLDLRKGFPESYDAATLAAALDGVRAGRPVEVPVYSHETYDIVAGATRVVPRAAVLLLEGVNALAFHDHLDLGIYVDAPVDAVERWYVDRLVALVAAAPPGTFYAGWAALDAAQVDALAHEIWRTINLVNLEEHIAPTSAFADVVVEKGAAHELLAVTPAVR